MAKTLPPFRITCRICLTDYEADFKTGVRLCPKCGKTRILYDPMHRKVFVEGQLGFDSFLPSGFREDGLYEGYVGPKQWRRGVGKKYSVPRVAPDSARAQGVMTKPILLKGIHASVK